MKRVLVDTCIWSLALRGKSVRDVAVSNSLSHLIDQGAVMIIGPIRQELLSGYSNVNQYLKLKTKLDYFPNEQILGEDYILAAEFSNACRVKGVQGSHIDFLICAVSVRANIEIFTTDKDFAHYKKYLPIELHAC